MDDVASTVYLAPPVGYEHCEQISVTRQIVIGGRNKYLINGHVAQPTRGRVAFT